MYYPFIFRQVRPWSPLPLPAPALRPRPATTTTWPRTSRLKRRPTLPTPRCPPAPTPPPQHVIILLQTWAWILTTTTITTTMGAAAQAREATIIPVRKAGAAVAVVVREIMEIIKGDTSQLVMRLRWEKNQEVTDICRKFVFVSLTSLIFALGPLGFFFNSIPSVRNITNALLKCAKN